MSYSIATEIDRVFRDSGLITQDKLLAECAYRAICLQRLCPQSNLLLRFVYMPDVCH